MNAEKAFNTLDRMRGQRLVLAVRILPKMETTINNENRQVRRGNINLKTNTEGRGNIEIIIMKSGVQAKLGSPKLKPLLNVGVVRSFVLRVSVDPGPTSAL